MHQSDLAFEACVPEILFRLVVERVLQIGQQQLLQRRLQLVVGDGGVPVALDTARGAQLALQLLDSPAAPMYEVSNPLPFVCQTRGQARHFDNFYLGLKCGSALANVGAWGSCVPLSFVNNSQINWLITAKPLESYSFRI